MKLFLSIMLLCSSLNAIIPPELGSYQKYVERCADGFSKELAELELEQAQKGTTQALVIRSGMFCQSYFKTFLQIRQMDIYTQNLIQKTVNKMVPFMEKLAFDTYRMKDKPCAK